MPRRAKHGCSPPIWQDCSVNWQREVLNSRPFLAFSPQICAQELAEMTPVPLVSLLDVIVAEVERRNLQRLSIFGARVTMETNLFGRLQNVEVVSPSPEEIDLVANTYVRIVEEEQTSQHDYENLRVLAHTLIHRERLDAILLAGTDLSFVLIPKIPTSHIWTARVSTSTPS